MCQLMYIQMQKLELLLNPLNLSRLNENMSSILNIPG